MNRRKMCSEQFENIASIESTYWWFQARYRHIARILGKKLDFNGEGVVVDWGCGTGGFIEYLAKSREFQKINLFGIEPSDHARQILNSRGIRCIKPDLTKPLQKQIGSPIKAITMLDVIEHIETPSEVLSYLREGVVPGGYLVVLAPAFKHLWSEWDDRLGHWRRYSTASLEKELYQGGWEVIKSQYLFSLMYFLGLIRKLMIRKKLISTVAFPDVSVNINKLLIWYFRFEASIPMLPFGTSVSVIAKKRDNAF